MTNPPSSEFQPYENIQKGPNEDKNILLVFKTSDTGIELSVLFYQGCSMGCLPTLTPKNSSRSFGASKLN